MICFPLDNTQYMANALGAWFGTRTRGVFSADGNLDVEAGNGMSVRVTPGLAWLKKSDLWGVCLLQEHPRSLTIDLAENTLTRKDAICCQLDKNKNEASIIVKKGTPAQSPVVPQPVRDENYDEIYLAAVNIRAGAIEITPADIEDLRMNENLCGLMRDGVTSLPSQELYDQWLAWFTELQAEADEKSLLFEQSMHFFKQNSEASFNEWFETMKGTLEEEPATALYKLIQDHEANKQNPHNTTAEQVGTYTAGEIDEKLDSKATKGRLEIHKIIPSDNFEFYSLDPSYYTVDESGRYHIKLRLSKKNKASLTNAEIIAYMPENIFQTNTYLAIGSMYGGNANSRHPIQLNAQGGNAINIARCGFDLTGHDLVSADFIYYPPYND